jgi:hypothetical protein
MRRKPAIDRFAFECELLRQGVTLLAGVDEAGRGPLAGPVVAAAAMLPVKWIESGLPPALKGLNDSKQLTPRQRERFFEALNACDEVTFAIAQEEADRVDEFNILQATHRAMNKALAALAPSPQHALVDGTRIGMGKSIAGGRPVQLVATLTPPVRGSAIVLIRNGKELASVNDGPQLTTTQPPAATSEAYRVEVRLPEAPGTPPVPWIVSNPIYVRVALGAPAPHARSVIHERAQFGGTLGPWTTERSVTSDGQVDLSGDADQRPALHFTWRLGDGQPAGQYAALSVPVKGHDLETFNTITLTISSLVPARVSVQLRIPHGAGLRWRRSIYADQRPRTVTIDLGEMKAVEAPPGTALDIARVDSLLVVVDTVNASPGSVGELWISDVKWQELAGH